MAGGLFPKDVQILFKKLFKNKEIKSVKPGSKAMKLGMGVMFVYDAKWKKSLPFWDRLPFSVILTKYPDGFLGINLHYVPWARRLQLVKKIYKLKKNHRRITYPMIKKAWATAKLPEALLMLSIRRYLYSHIRSQIKLFDWDTYYDVVKDIRPKFVKENEQTIHNILQKKWNVHKKKTKKSKR